MRTETTLMQAELLRLAQSLDALFPIGSYTLSNGMETYVQKGIVGSREELERYLDAYLYLLTFNDLAFANRAAAGEDIPALDALFGALKTPYETRTGSEKQCIRFLKAHTELDRYPLLEQYRQWVKEGVCGGHYCIAMGLFIRETKVEVETALNLYGYSLLSAAVNHAVKLVPLRQMDGQKALLKAGAKLPQAVCRAIEVKDDELGASGCGFDLRSMQHERLYSRLYIS